MLHFEPPCACSCAHHLELCDVPSGKASRFLSDKANSAVSPGGFVIAKLRRAFGSWNFACVGKQTLRYWS